MVTPLVIFTGKFSVDAAENTTDQRLRTITINGLDDSEQLAARPAFEGFNWNDMTQNQPNTPGYRTHNVGLYPPNRLNSGSRPGMLREFEEAIVIVQPLNSLAADPAHTVYGKVVYTDVTEDLESSTVPHVRVQFHYSGTPPTGTKVYQFVVLKKTSNLYAS